MIKHILAIAILALCFTACQSDKGKKDMSDFADDKEFKEAHETPGEADADNTGKVIDGNGRAYELLRRAGNPQ